LTSKLLLLITFFVKFLNSKQVIVPLGNDREQVVERTE